MSDKLESIILDSVANTNFKNIAEGGAFYSGLAMADAISGQRRFHEIGNVATGNLLKNFTKIEISEANALVKANTGFDRGSQSHDVASVLAQFGAVLGAIQMNTKIAQTTPPQTGSVG